MNNVNLSYKRGLKENMKDAEIKEFFSNFIPKVIKERYEDDSCSTGWDVLIEDVNDTDNVVALYSSLYESEEGEDKVRFTIDSEVYNTEEFELSCEFSLEDILNESHIREFLRTYKEAREVFLDNIETYYMDKE